MDETIEHWYRYESRVYGHVDDFGGSWSPPRVHLYRHSYPVISHTPKGVWLLAFGKRRWVSNHSRKRFAHATEQEALRSFIARKERQISICHKQISNAQRAANMAALKLKAYATNET